MSTVGELPDGWLEQQKMAAELELLEMGVGDAFVDIALKIWLKGLYAGIRESLDALAPCSSHHQARPICDRHLDP